MINLVFFPLQTVYLQEITFVKDCGLGKCTQAELVKIMQSIGIVA